MNGLGLRRKEIFADLIFAEAGEIMADGAGNNHGPSAHCHDDVRCFFTGNA